jgi:general secretion pathway protein F
MGRFAYTAIDPKGRETSGVISAASETAARAGLERKRLLPVALREAAGEQTPESAADRAALSTGARLGHLSLRQRLMVTQQLAVLIEAAAPVDEALAMTAAQQEDAKTRRILREVHAGVLEGLRLGEALSRHPRSFPGLYRAAVAGGERSGRLGRTLRQLADYLLKAEKIRTKIITASIYPIALMVVALGVVSALMIFVVPTLSEQFVSLGQELPIVTRALMGVSWFLSQFWPLLLGLGAGLAAVAAMLLRQTPVRRAVDRFFLTAPGLGRQVKAINASRFVRAVALLTASGAPVLDSVRAARDAVDHLIVRDAIAGIAEQIEQGEPLSRAMRASGAFPMMTSYMAASGENAGELPAMLERAADQLDQDLEAFTDTALGLLEPAIILAMGAMVAGIVLAIMTPILELNRMALG